MNIQIAHNPVTAKIIGGDDNARVILANLMSYYVDGYEHTNAFQQKRWDGKSTFFKYSNDTFPRGFVEIAIAELRDAGYNINLLRHPAPTPLGETQPKVDEFGYSERYDYQVETVDNLLEYQTMIARVATGGGKSRIARIAHARIKRRTLFITTRQLLMYQMKKGFEENGFPCGVIGDGTWEPITTGGHYVNVAMIQTLAERLKEPPEYDESADAMRQRRVRKKTLEFLETVDLLIGEEAHEAGGDGYFNVIRSCKNSYYKLALTATPFMRDNAEANMRLMACFGRIGIDVSEKMLIERNVLSRPIFKFADVKEVPKRLTAGMSWQRAYELGVVENQYRNQYIVDHCKLCKDYGLTAMILVQRRKHGDILEDMLKKSGLKARFIYGDSNPETREKALKQLASKELDVLIGSTILDVGVDVPSVGSVVNAGGGKAEVAFRQRVGRGLREKKTGPNVCPFLDFKDKNNKFLLKHAKSRLEIVKNTPGFAENLLSDNKDFDLEEMGFSKVT